MKSNLIHDDTTEPQTVCFHSFSVVNENDQIIGKYRIREVVSDGGNVDFYFDEWEDNYEYNEKIANALGINPEDVRTGNYSDLVNISVAVLQGGEIKPW